MPTIPTQSLAYVLAAAFALNLIQLFFHYRSRSRVRVLQTKIAELDTAVAPRPITRRLRAVWALAHVAFLIGALFIVLQQLAENFNANEHLSLLWFGLVAIADRLIGPNSLLNR